jgi:integrase
MPKPKKYWGIEANRNRHGRLRWYFRRPDKKGAPRVRLPDTYGSLEFEAAWRACMAGQPLPLPPGQGPAPGARRASRGSLGWLIALYLASPAFIGNRASTQRPRRTMLEKLAVSKGQVDIEDITRAVIQDSMNARRETVHMANAWLGVVSGMFEWATEERLDPETGRSFRLEANPCEFVKRFPAPKKDDLHEEDDDGHPTWSDEDLDAFEAAYSHGTRQRLIYEVLLCTGLRVGDAARVGKQHVKDGVLRLKTEKTRTPVALRVLPRLTHALAVGPKGLDTELAWITLKRTGKAMDKNYLGRMFGEACRKIGLDRSAHGLRKAAARRYIEAGARPEQLKAIFGWETSAMVDKYTKKFNRAKVAIRAMDDFVLDAAFSPTLVSGGGKGV